MKKTLTIVVALVMVLTAVFALAACGGNKSETALAVEKASKMTLEQLEAASKEEMENASSTFKVVGLTSVLKSTLTAFINEYEWMTEDNTYVKSDYKDYTLLQALETAETKYFADFALVQDVRSIANYDGDLLHNYVPSDYKDLGLGEDDIYPLKGIYFNKLFWTNKNFENVTGKKLENIWQLAGIYNSTSKQYVMTDGETVDAKHISNVSFQSAATEQINMSFLLSCEAPENQKRIEDAYKSYYGVDWESDEYVSAGQQWVTQFIENITVLHKSDGTAMKETQLADDWDAGYVYYGAFAKMKDAVGQSYTVTAADSTSQAYLDTFKGADGKVNAMETVQWDWEIEGFNGFMYAMCSQVVNNAEHPYTACLYARFLATRGAYENAVYNGSLPKREGSEATKVNQYGYYFPGDNDIEYAKGDWTRDEHIAVELVENFEYLKDVKLSQVNRILALIGQRPVGSK